MRIVEGGYYAEAQTSIMNASPKGLRSAMQAQTAA